MAQVNAYGCLCSGFKQRLVGAWSPGFRGGCDTMPSLHSAVCVLLVGQAIQFITCVIQMRGLLSALSLLAFTVAANAIKLKFRYEECMQYDLNMYEPFYGSFVALPDLYSLQVSLLDEFESRLLQSVSARCCTYLQNSLPRLGISASTRRAVAMISERVRCQMGGARRLLKQRICVDVCNTGEV